MVLSYYVSLFSEFSVVMSGAKRCSVRLGLRLFVGGGGVMSYLRNLCLFEYGGVQHVQCCVFVFPFFVLCTLCCKFL